MFARWIARRVLPVPPGPVSVIRPVSERRSNSVTSSTWEPRPMSSPRSTGARLRARSIERGLRGRIGRWACAHRREALGKHEREVDFDQILELGSIGEGAVADLVLVLDAVDQILQQVFTRVRALDVDELGLLLGEAVRVLEA